MNQTEQAAVWAPHARQWSKVGPPLKPSEDDLRLVIAALEPVFRMHPERCPIALLGVTPELVQLPWPAAVTLNAFDHSAQMIATVWAPHPGVSSTVTQAQWQKLPVEEARFCAVVGDGALNTLPCVADYDEVLQELCRVMVPGALAVLRCFIRPDQRQTLEEVRQVVSAGRIGSFHAFKWCLAQSLADGPSASVAVAQIHAAFEAYFPDRTVLAEMTGWPKEQIDTIDAYKDAPTSYSFPTLDQMRIQCAPYFEVKSIDYPGYALAQRFPTLTLQRKGAEKETHE